MKKTLTALGAATLGVALALGPALASVAKDGTQPEAVEVTASQAIDTPVVQADIEPVPTPEVGAQQFTEIPGDGYCGEKGVPKARFAVREEPSPIGSTFEVYFLEGGCTVATTIHFSSYSLDQSAANESTSFGQPTTYPQTLFNHGKDVVIEAGKSVEKDEAIGSSVVTVPPCGDYQTDAYTGPVLDIVGAGGHHSNGNTFFAGGIKLGAECVKPEPDERVNGSPAFSTECGTFTVVTTGETWRETREPKGDRVNGWSGWNEWTEIAGTRKPTTPKSRPATANELIKAECELPPTEVKTEVITGQPVCNAIGGGLVTETSTDYRRDAYFVDGGNAWGDWMVVSAASSQSNVSGQQCPPPIKAVTSSTSNRLANTGTESDLLVMLAAIGLAIGAGFILVSKIAHRNTSK